MAQYKYKLKEAPSSKIKGKFKIGDSKISKGVKYTVTNIDKETGGVKWDVDYLPNLTELFEHATELVQTSKGVYLKAKDDPKFRDIYEEAKDLKNKIRTHIRNEYPDDYRRITMNIDEMSTTGGGAGAASFTPGTGAQYATPYAFRKKGQKTNDKAYKEIGYKSINEVEVISQEDILNYADQYHMELVDSMKEVKVIPDKRTGGMYVKFPHYNGPDYTGATFGKDVTDRIKKSKGAAITAANKTYDKFQDYIEDYDITDSKSGVYGSVWLWIMPKYFHQFENIDMDRVFMKGKDKEKFYVTINRGHGDGKSLVKSSESEFTKPREFTRDEAVAYVERATSGGGTPGRIYSYWVSDINMDRIDEIFGKETNLLKDFGQNISKDDFKNKIPIGKTVIYGGSRYEVMANNGIVLKLKALGSGNNLTVNLGQFIDQGAINENKKRTSTISKQRAKAELKDQLKGTRADGMGKYTAIVYGMDGNKRVALKSMDDINKYSKFEIGDNKDALKENVGATLGPGPKAGPDGVKDSAYTKQFKYKLVPKKIKGSGIIVKQIFEEESKKNFQQKRIGAFDGVEKKLNNIYTMVSNAKNETADYYKNNPNSYLVVKPTDLIMDYLEDIEKLLKGE